jgi:hypothetical protein
MIISVPDRLRPAIMEMTGGRIIPVSGGGTVDHVNQLQVGIVIESSEPRLLLQQGMSWLDGAEIPYWFPGVWPETFWKDSAGYDGRCGLP